MAKKQANITTCNISLLQLCFLLLEYVCTPKYFGFVRVATPFHHYKHGISATMCLVTACLDLREDMITCKSAFIPVLSAVV